MAPRRGFTLHHNGPPANCVGRPHTRCLAFWEAVRRFHTDPEPAGQGWSGIAYSFGVCPHGERLTGQGWDRRQFANGKDLVGADNGDDAEWYTVLAFVGGDPSTGDKETPTPQMVAAVADLIDDGRGTGRCGLAVAPHNWWKRKPCPGIEFTALAGQWNGRPSPLLAPTPPPVLEDDPDMLIIDCKGKPALIVGVGGVKRLTTAQRNALREIGVDAKLVDPATSDALYSLHD